MKRSILSMLGAVVLLAMTPAVSQAGLITLQSGNGGGGVGSTDTVVTDIAGPATTGFTTVLNFGALPGASPSYILSPSVPGWTATLPGSSAQWIGPTANSASNPYNGSGETALYAVPFSLPDTHTPVTLTFTYMADNYLGETTADGKSAVNNAGLFINGHALAASTTYTGGGDGNNFFVPTTLTYDITSLVTASANTLYINVTNNSGWAGLIFSATISTPDPSAVPEPSTFFMGGTAVVFGLIAYRRRNRNVA